MQIGDSFNKNHIKAIAVKEFIHVKRDFVTLLWLMLIPIVEIIFFGYIMNTNPKHLPAALVASENTQFTRSILQGLTNTEYFKIDHQFPSEALAQAALLKGDEQFIINIPPSFSRDLVRGKIPHMLIEADATDPVAVTNAFKAAGGLPATVLQYDLHGQLSHLEPTPSPFVIDIQEKYNPDELPELNTVPGLIALLLGTSMIILTAISISAEYEHGTFETLLTTPASGLDVIIGKMVPHLFIGYILLLVMMTCSIFIFDIPFYGSFTLYLIIVAPYFVANLGTGLAISSVCRTQYQAASLTNAYILPTILMSGFLFPFRGMPVIAQKFGEILPLTHFLRITRGIMLKGSSFVILWPDIWPILLYMVIIILIGALSFRKTLD